MIHLFRPISQPMARKSQITTLRPNPSTNHATRPRSCRASASHRASERRRSRRHCDSLAPQLGHWSIPAGRDVPHTRQIGAFVGIKPATAADASAIGNAKCATGCKDAGGAGA